LLLRAALVNADKTSQTAFSFYEPFRGAFYVIGVALLSAAATNEAVITQFYPCSAFRLTTDDIVMQIATSCMASDQP